MATVIAVAFGGMMAAALTIVVLGSFSTAGRNTRDLLAIQTDLVLDYLTDEVDHFLAPAETALLAARDMLAEDIDTAQVRQRMAGVLAMAPQLVTVFVLHSDGSAQLLGGNGPNPPQRTEERWRRLFFDGASTRQVRWQAPLWSPILDTTVINARLAIGDPQEPEAVIVAGVRLGVFADLLDDLSFEIDQEVFVLLGWDRVVAHSHFANSAYDLGPGRPLPRIEEAGLPQLRRMWVDTEPFRFLTEGFDGRGLFLEHEDTDYAIIYREIFDYGRPPWLVGMLLDLKREGEQVERLIRSAIIAVVISIAAVVITLKMGRRMARPVERIARRAHAIQQLKGVGLEPLPTSHIRELNDASNALNAMSAAMRWFEAYLPRRLVAQLMVHGSPDNVSSQERDVTIMFTDIVGFSSKAAMLSARETAEFLNGHFAILEKCINDSDGTIDKYMGDGIMAFWGAPQDQPDHPARAVCAAIAIREQLAQTDTALRIGLHRGSALVGNIGAPGRLNYTLVGETVNVTQRLEALGKDLGTGEQVTILASGAVMRDAQAPSDSCGRQMLRGQASDYEVFRL